MKQLFYGSFVAWVTRIPAVVNVFGGMGYPFTDRPQETSVLCSLLQREPRWVTALNRSIVVMQNPDDRDVLVHESVVTSSRVRYQSQTSLDRLWIHLWPSVVFLFFLFVKTLEEAMVSQRVVSGGSGQSA